MEKVKLFSPQKIMNCQMELAALTHLGSQEEPLYKFSPGKGFLVMHGYKERTKPNYLPKQSVQRHFNSFIEKNVIKCFYKPSKAPNPIGSFYEPGSQKITPSMRKTAQKFRIRRRRASMQIEQNKPTNDRNIVLKDILDIKREMIENMRKHQNQQQF